MESFKYKNKEVIFWSVTGEILSQNKFSKTNVYSRGDGPFGGGPHNTIESSVTTRHDVWIKKQDGSEEVLKFDNEEIHLREGQKITLVYAGYKVGDGCRYLLVNHNSKERWVLNNAEDLGRYLGIVKIPFYFGFVFLFQWFVLFVLITLPVGLIIWVTGIPEKFMDEAMGFIGPVTAIVLWVRSCYKITKAVIETKKMRKVLNLHLDNLGQKILQKTSGDDSSRYSYEINELKGANLPKAGELVDFSAKEEKAEAIYPDAPAANNNSGISKRLVAALLAFFLGGLGIHKFYLGYKKQGIIMLLVFFLGFILLGFPTIIISIVAFIEFVIYLLKSDEEFEQTYVVGQKGWF